MWIRSIKPRWLREKIFWHWFQKQPPNRGISEDVPLAFCPSVRLDLQSTCISHRQIECLGYIDHSLTKAIRDVALAEGGLFVDVGANWGYFTCLWAATAPAGRVVAFEASPRNIEGLAKNVARNSLADRVKIQPLALGKEEGVLQFELGPEDQSGWGGLTRSGSATSATVHVTTLDNSFRDDGTIIAALKIDTEGADTWVIEGAQSLLQAKRIRRLFFEDNPTRMQALGIQPGTAKAVLQSAGYTVEACGPSAWHAYLPGFRTAAAFG